MPYPIVVETALAAPERSMFRSFRDPDKLPPLFPGAVYVFHTGGRYVTHRMGVRPDKYDPVLVDAVSVSVVDVRPQSVVVSLTMASNSPADDFTVSATFSCAVTDPEVVVARGMTDVVPPLREYLRQDNELLSIGTDYRVQDVNAVTRRVSDRLMAYQTIVPPYLDGMEVSVSSVRVSIPPKPRQWAEVERDKLMEREIRRITGQIEDDEILRLNGHLDKGINRTAALAIARGSLDSAAVVQAYVNDREAAEHRRQDLLARLIQADHTVGMCPEEIEETVAEILTGRTRPTLDHTDKDDSPRRSLPHGSSGDRPGAYDPTVGDEDDLL